MTDELEEPALDLSAWEAPDAPDDLADAVLARMAGTGVVPSVPDVQAPRRRAVLIAGVAAACLVAAAGVVLIVRGTERAAPTSGTVVADVAKSVTLDTARVELDPGAKVSWVRKDDVLHVQQPTGAAAWRVAEGETVRIDAGATVASVEATGASLRVEVKMNQTDARVIGGAAVTAMAVSMVTVVVYEGHVKVSGSRGQPTVIVQPGSTYTVAPPPVLPEPPIVGAPTSIVDDGAARLGEVRITPGESATIHAALFPVAVEFAVPTGCKLSVEGQVGNQPLAMLQQGAVAYNVQCNGPSDRTFGTWTLVADEAKRKLFKQPDKPTPIAADGRIYRVSFSDMTPTIEVAGSGTLYVEERGKALTFSPPIIPAGRLEAGDYSYWFDPAKKSTLVLEVDYMSPVLRIAEVTWEASSSSVSGETLPQSTLSVNDIPVTLDGGRFSVGVDEADVFSLRVAHPHRGNHYYVVRSPLAIASRTRGIDRAGFNRKMSSLEAGISALCRFKGTAPGPVNIAVKVDIATDGSVTATVAPALAAKEREVAECVLGHVRGVKFPPAKVSASYGYSFSIDSEPVCDWSTPYDRGLALMQQRKYEAALTSYEQALLCAPSDGDILSGAVMAACSAGNEAAAHRHFAKVPADDHRMLVDYCQRSGILLGAKTVATCDAAAAKEQGMNHINSGQHAAALVKFEESLRCKDDPYVRQLAFMEACASGNSPKAKIYYKRLTPVQQTKFAQVCIRQKPPVEYQDPVLTNTEWGGPDDGTKGYLEVFSTPEAKILIDGVDTGLTTPVTGRQLMLTAGKHKVTFVIDEDRFTYPVTTKVGETQRMSKDLQ